MIRSASIVSARILPMTKAPKADEKPTREDSTAIRQHSPKATMSSVSSLTSLRTRRRKLGTTYNPTTNHRTRKNTIFMMLSSICPPLSVPPPAMALSMTIITMARMSSRMSTLMTLDAKFCCDSPISLNAL